MTCPHCGAQSAEGARFCASCGAAVEAPPVLVQPAVAAEVPAAPDPAPEAPATPEVTAPAEPAVTYVIPPPPVFAPAPPPPAPPAPAYAPPAPPASEYTPPAAPAYAQAPPAAASGWPKAPLPARFFGSVVDSFIMLPLLVPASVWMAADLARDQAPVGGIVLMALGGLWMFFYAYFKDGFKGASFGKRITGLMVVRLQDNRPAGMGASFIRALILNLISPIEAIMVLVDARGQRLGDKLAKTQVVRMDDYAAAAPGWVRPGKGLAVGLLVASLLIGAGGGVASAVAFASRPTGDFGTTPPFIEPSTSGTQPSTGAPAAATDADVHFAADVVAAFYTAINEADMTAIKGAVVPDLRSQADPGAFEGWSTTTFEFTRGWIDGMTAHVVGRESRQAYGSGDGGGVEFTLTNTDGTWLISGWNAVDTTQVEGSDTTGSSTGIPGPLTDATARDIVTQALEARRSGTANVVRRLATAKFLADNGTEWLSGMDNADSFTAFKITSVKVSGSSATVTVGETWPDGVGTATYGLVETGGAVLLDSWVVK